MSPSEVLVVLCFKSGPSMHWRGYDYIANLRLYRETPRLCRRSDGVVKIRSTSSTPDFSRLRAQTRLITEWPVLGAAVSEAR